MATEIYSNYKSPNIMKTHKERIIIVDVLRGFALFMIVIIHFVEHFDFMRRPEVNFLFSHELDTKVKDIVFMLVSGKAYSVFAVLFGLSFFIQMDKILLKDGCLIVKQFSPPGKFCFCESSFFFNSCFWFVSFGFI